MKKRILSCLLLVCMMLSAVALAACKKTDDTDPSETTTATPQGGDTDEGSGVPDGLNFDDTVTWFIWSNHTMTEFYADQLSGETVSDEIYDRNVKLQKQLGVTFEYLEEHNDNFQKKLEADNSGDGIYEIIGQYSVSGPTFAKYGFYANALEPEFKYFDFTKEWWPSGLVEQSTIGGNLFFFSGDISTNLLWMMTVLYYNKDLAKDWNLPDLYELVDNYQWTQEKLYELTKDVYTDLNSNQKKDKEDFYGLGINGVNLDAFATAAGAYSVVKDPNTDLLKVNDDYYGEYMVNVIDMGIKLYNSTGTYYYSNTGSANRGYFTQGQALFWPDRTFMAARELQAEGVNVEFGVLPIPMYAESQQQYITNVGHPFTMYSISANVIDAVDKEKVSAVIQEMSYYNYKYVTPEIFDTSLKNRYADEPDDARMFEICRDGIVFEMGRLANNAIDSSASSGYRTTVISGANGWATNAARYKRLVGLKLDELNATYQKIGSR